MNRGLINTVVPGDVLFISKIAVSEAIPCFISKFKFIMGEIDSLPVRVHKDPFAVLIIPYFTDRMGHSNSFLAANIFGVASANADRNSLMAQYGCQQHGVMHTGYHQSFLRLARCHQSVFIPFQKFLEHEGDCGKFHVFISPVFGYHISIFPQVKGMDQLLFNQSAQFIKRFRELVIEISEFTGICVWAELKILVEHRILGNIFLCFGFTGPRYKEHNENHQDDDKEH